MHVFTRGIYIIKVCQFFFIQKSRTFPHLTVYAIQYILPYKSYCITHELGTPINVRSNAFEARLSLAAIIQNCGFGELYSEFSPDTNPMNTSKIVHQGII